MKKDLLKSPIWTYKAVMEYIGCKRTKAFEIMKKVKRFYNGAVPDLNEYVKRDALLNYLGSSIERELYIDNLIKKGGK